MQHHFWQVKGNCQRFHSFPGEVGRVILDVLYPLGKYRPNADCRGSFTKFVKAPDRQAVRGMSLLWDTSRRREI